MKKILLLVSAAVALALIAIQLVPAERSNPPVLADFDGPDAVKEILRTSCYDCHSNETVWPWYSYVAPVSWSVAEHVREAREELNFSDWASFRGDAHLMEEIYEETKEGHMPIGSYLRMHPGAKLSEAQLAVLKAYFYPEGSEHDEHEHEHD
ncbi:heme-binding domain-containing protein [Coraliomargarita parva]|uniref:heme-binding domain-containing protein n=1 Tax=Coraliomargarita parva TaxID=3014050 RepID=UPI0022B5E23B|nr:heme-binding domain-containing protein [Coraliomargarita parva]